MSSQSDSTKSDEELWDDCVDDSERMMREFTDGPINLTTMTQMARDMFVVRKAAQQ